MSHVRGRIAPRRPIPDAIIDQLAAAYRAGRAVPYEPERPSNNDPYWGLVDDIQATRVPLPERLVFLRCRRTVAEALVRARRGQLALASQLFGEVRRLVESGHRPHEVRTLGRVIYLAAIAYVSYRQSHYALAREQVQEALGLDLRLENEYGYDILHLHRITLISNLARIAVREEGPGQAVSPLVNILLYLEGARPGLEFLTPSRVSIETLPADPIRQMMLGFASDLTILWSDLGPADMVRHWPIVQPVEQERETARFQRLIAGAFQLKGPRPDAPDARPEGALSAALSGGRPPAPRLWYGLVADMARWLAGDASPEGLALREEIARDAARWADLPPVFFRAIAG
jgi:hypothetical protein